MTSRADERSRALGGVVVLTAVLLGFLFLAGLSAQSYWALALPVAAATFFVLGLVVWIGWTIATVQVPASGDPLPPTGNPSGAAAEVPSEEPDSSHS